MSVSAERYSDNLLAYFYHPKNVGKFDDAKANVGTGRAGTVANGELVQLQLEVGDAGDIKDTRFKAHGSCATIAAMAWLADSLIGQTLEEARKINNDDIVHYFDLPAVKISSSILAEDALQAAINDAEQRA